jgi:hypothetical protein
LGVLFFGLWVWKTKLRGKGQKSGIVDGMPLEDLDHRDQETRQSTNIFTIGTSETFSKEGYQRFD